MKTTKRGTNSDSKAVLKRRAYYWKEKAQKALVTMRYQAAMFEEISNARRKSEDEFTKVKKELQQARSEADKTIRDLQSKMSDLQERHSRCMELLSSIVVHHGGVMAVRRLLPENKPVIQICDDQRLNATILSI